MPQADEQSIQQALADYRAGIFNSYRAAGQTYNVPHTTLSRRDKGTTTTRTIARESQQLFPTELERHLIDWILYCETCGYPITHAQIREFVLLLLQSMNQPTVLGKEWVSRFIHRHNELATKIGQKIDIQRFNNANEEDLQLWFSRLSALMTKLHLTPQNLYNCDETGIALGIYTNTRVVGTSSTRTVRVKRPENREWVSIVECISASPVKLRPLVIFKAKSTL